jgi:shikimate kinase
MIILYNNQEEELNMLPSLKIILFGVKHSGKTSIGKRISQILNWPFHDLDDSIETQTRALTGASIRDFYHIEERSRFFTIEKQCLDTWLRNRAAPWILSTGGGIIDNEEAIEIIPPDTIKVFLHNNPEELFRRIEKKGLPPFLMGEDPFQKFLALYASRTARYKQIIDIIVELGTGSKEENAEIVLHSIKEFIHARK